MLERAPGPRGHFLLGNLREYRKDVLGLMLRASREHGDVVRMRIGPFVSHLISHPDLVAQVLQTRSANYDKQTRSSTVIGSICATSLLTANGEAWKRRRRLMQPCFHRQQIACFTCAMTGCIERRLSQWRIGEPLDVAVEMMHMTYAIVGSTLLGTDVSESSARIGEAVTGLLEDVYQRWGRIVDWPLWLPVPANRRFHRELAEVNRQVERIIAGHREAPERCPDLLSMLMQARDADTGEGFSDAELRNETITMLIAGHETTANALTWTLALLSGHPEVEERMREEIAQVLGQRVPTFEDVPGLVFTTQVLRESMRLYPPIWAMERRAIAADEIGGYRIPAGASIIVSPYVMHRDARYWDEPERFRPERFAGNGQHEAYLPFGAGPRYCIGNEFAMLEARLILVMILQRFRLERVAKHRIEPHPCITLRLRHGLPMVPRQPGA
ncbi:MAG TPA: cytochrome P450 [Luteolibacter sp.]|nr:cytochrome P450 [Luteolibacter sp.]